MLRRFRKATDTLLELFLYYAVMMTVSAIIFSIAEDVPLTTAFYWAGITATTTGYGDISPHTVVGRIVSVALANAAVFILGPLIIARMLESLVDNPHHFSHEEQEKIKSSLERLEKLLQEKEN